MKTLPAILLLLALLAGCTDSSPDASADDRLPEGAGNQTATPPSLDVADPSGPSVTMEPMEPTADGTAQVRGTVSSPTNLTLQVLGAEGLRGEQSLAADGPWSAEVALAFGVNQVVASTEQGASAAIEAVRLAQATVQVLYTAYPAHDDTEDTVLFNVDARPTSADYADRDVEHPGFFTVHDLLATFSEQTGTPIEYDYSNGLGFAPIRFDGVGQPLTSDAPPWWCYKVNGESAGLGASITQAMPGDVVTWEYSSCMV